MNIIFLFLNFLVLLFVSSCSYDKTTFDINSLFDPTWDFSNKSEFIFNENFVEVKDGKVQLKPLDLKHENNDFKNGSYVGSYWNLSSQNIEMINKVNSSLDVRVILPLKTNSLLTYMKLDSNLENLALSGEEGSLIGSLAYSNDSQVGTSSLVLDSSQSNFLIVNDADVGTGAFTAAAWLNPSTYRDWGRLLAESNVSPDQDWLVLEHSSDGQWYFSITMTNGVGCSTNTSNYIKVPLNSWTHITAVYSGSSVSLYKNGTLAAGPVSCSHPIRNNNSSMGVGSNVSGGSTFDGKIDEIAIWSEELDTNEILKIYQTQARNYTELSPSWTPKWNNIIGYWKMDDNWLDSSGNNRHATVNNTASFLSSAKVGSYSGFKPSGANYLSLGPSPFFAEAATELTIMSWFFIDPAVFDGSLATLFDSATGAPNSNNGLTIFLDDRGGGNSTNSLGMIIKTGSTYEHVRGPDNIFPHAGWYHLAMTYGNNNAHIYLNGTNITNMIVDGSGDYIPRNTALFLGARLSGGGAVSLGFDDISFFSKELRANEVSQVYNRQKQKHAGSYESEVIDFGSTASKWPDFSWSTSLPFGKELTGENHLNTESSTDYNLLASNFNNNLVGYWNFNERTKGAAPGGSDFMDSSGKGLHMTESTSMQLGKVGKLAAGLQFDGTNDVLRAVTSGKVEIPTESETSVSLWLKIDPIQVNIVGTSNYIAENRDTTGGLSHYHFSVRLNNQTFVGTKPAGTIRCARYDGSNNPVAITDQIVSDGKWHHIVCQTRAGQQEVYVDGQLDTSVPDTTVALNLLNNDEFYFGANRVGHRNFLGAMDEIAIWTRSLSPDEIRELYRRGANRIKFQVKSCVDSSCECKSFNVSPAGNANDCDGDGTINALDIDDNYQASFIGPGGDDTTFYSELFNRTATDLSFNCGLNSSDGDSNICVGDEINLKAGPRPTGPNIDFSDFPLQARPVANPYFQYRVYLEADENTACNGGPCFPQLTSVDLNPGGGSKFYGALQEVLAINPQPFQEISSIKIDADDCATYQLSPDGTNYFYVNNGQWAPALDNSQRSTRPELEDHIVKFSNNYGPGLLHLKVFLQTNLNQSSSCGVRAVDISSQNR